MGFASVVDSGFRAAGTAGFFLTVRVAAVAGRSFPERVEALLETALLPFATRAVLVDAVFLFVPLVLLRAFSVITYLRERV